ncbi:HNH endonuclease [Streptomyces sp. NBC_00414]
MKPAKQPNGYFRVVLFGNGKRRNASLHVLMLESFVSPRPEGHIACHGPNGKSDNSLSNLYWGTPLANNTIDRLRDGTEIRGEDHGRALLTNQDVLDIRETLATGKVRQVDLAKEYGVSRQTINHVFSRYTWKHL